MVVGAFRAMVTARLQLLWNTVCRGEGLVGLLAASVMAAGALALLVPSFWMFSVFGEVLGRDLAAADSPALTWLSGLHALVVLLLGGLAGLRLQRGFDRELLRMHPLRPVQLLLAELPFGLLDTIPVLGFTLFLGLGVGLIRALPELWPAVALVIAMGMLTLLLVQQVAGVVRRLVSRPRAIALAAVLLLPPALLVAWLASRRGLDEVMALVVDHLPTTAGHLALRAFAQGDAGRGATFLAVCVAFTGALFALATWLQLRELSLDPPLRAVGGTRETLWSFRQPPEGVARLFVSQVLGSRLGKLVVITPAFLTFMFVLAATILRRSAVGRDPEGFHLTIQTLAEQIQALPLYLIVPPAAAAFGAELWLNQFAWHGHGVKALFLAPMSTRDLLRGKLGGLSIVQALQALLACLPLLALRLPNPWELATGLAALALVVTTLGTLGHALSARFPRPHRGEGEGSGAAPALLGLIATAALAALAALLFAVTFGLGRFGPWVPPVTLGALAGLALLARRAALPALVSQVDDHREHVVETLG